MPAMIDHVRVAVKALITREPGEVLLVRRAPIPGSSNPLKYNLPGGAIQPGETLVAALKREIYEETALEIVIDGIVGVREWVAPRHRATYVGVFFACTLGSNVSKLRLNDENCEYVWANSKSISSLALMDSSGSIVRDFLGSCPLLPHIGSMPHLGADGTSG